LSQRTVNETRRAWRSLFADRGKLTS